MRRHWSRRGYRRGKGPSLKILLFPIVLFLCIWLLDSGLRPVVNSVTTNEARIASIDAINQAVTAQMQGKGVSYGDLIHIERSSAGGVQSVTTDMVKMNELKAAVIAQVQKSLGNYGHKDMGIPVGTLFGGELFHGRGPEVPLRLTLSGNVTAEYKSTFESAGINQTKHQIVLEICASIYSFIPGFDETIEVTTGIPIAETVIVGEVPQFMADIGGTAGAK